MADPTKDVVLLRAVLQRVLNSQAGKASTLSGNMLADVRGVLEQTAPPKRRFMVPMFALVEATTAVAAEELAGDVFGAADQPGVQSFVDPDLDAVEISDPMTSVDGICDFYPVLKDAQS
ncbi:MAG: hypothetical protein ACK5XA_08495 [Tagaea sp.]